MPAEQEIRSTSSLCPVCLKKISARICRIGADVYLRKTCPEHGPFRTILWRGDPDYVKWAGEKTPEPPDVCQSASARGCPFDCGLCPEHRQKICCAQFEVTQRCNLHCPVCFADAGEQAEQDLPLQELLEQMRQLYNTSGRCNLQLSGGEPTVRDDLPQLIRGARELGYTFFQLNTNGLRLAEEPAYARALKEAGLSTVFLQFDGTTDAIYRRLRGRDLLEIKRRAIEVCGQNQLGVVLVPVLVPAVNVENIGEIIRFALAHMPVVRGVHFQPVSYFGRYPTPPEDAARITIPEVLRELEWQTQGLVRVENFAPSDCEHPLCSFHGDFIYLRDGELTPVTRKQSCCGHDVPGQAPSVVRSQNYVASRWQMTEPAERCCGQDAFDELLDRIRNYRISITCMAFQDVENVDLERLKYCCIPVIRNGKAIPFCAYNITSRDGRGLYRGTC